MVRRLGEWTYIYARKGKRLKDTKIEKKTCIEVVGLNETGYGAKKKKDIRRERDAQRTEL